MIPGVTTPVLRPHRTSPYTRKTDNCLVKPLLVTFSTICTKHIFKQYSLFQKVCTDTQQESLIVSSVRCFNILLLVQINIMNIELHGAVSPWFDYHKSEGQAEHLCCEIAMSRSKCSIMTPWRHHMIDLQCNPRYVFLFIATHIYKYIEFIYNGWKWLPQSRGMNPSQIPEIICLPIWVLLNLHSQPKFLTACPSCMTPWGFCPSVGYLLGKVHSGHSMKSVLPSYLPQNKSTSSLW